MTREFLEKLGIESDSIEKILSENKKDTNREAAKTTAAQEKLATAQQQLSTTQADLETLRKSNGDVAAIQQQFAELQAKYDTDIADRDAKIAERDYMDAVKSAVAGKGLKFSSRAAERDFMAQAKAKQMELKDGNLTGFDDFVTAQQEADPGAFASDKPAPHFVGPVGSGGAPAPHVPPNVQQAKEMGEARAAALKASSDAMKAFT